MLDKLWQTPFQNIIKISLHIFAFQNVLDNFLNEKYLYFNSGQWLTIINISYLWVYPSPLLADISPSNVSFFLWLPYIRVGSPYCSWARIFRRLFSKKVHFWVKKRHLIFGTSIPCQILKNCSRAFEGLSYLAYFLFTSFNRLF